MPIELVISSTQSNDIDSDWWEVEKELKFQEKIYNIQKQAHEMLQQAKSRHDKHCIPHSFQIGDQVWLHLKNERCTSPYKKLNP